MDAARERMADAQEGVLKALLTGTAPPGFAADRMVTAGRTLRRKRARALARAWPALAAALGDRFTVLFADYAIEVLCAPGGSAAADGYQFARYLRASGALPREARVELARFELTHRATRAGLRHRRVGFVAARELATLRIGLLLPGLGPRWIVLRRPARSRGDA
jgi:hypothetical protein